ncbi:MAG: hypothetical protein LBC56_08805 [Oscillospiraceae bacterium]|nr:hypothetical protein [Oscillospiraceae bacterium]
MNVFSNENTQALINKFSAIAGLNPGEVGKAIKDGSVGGIASKISPAAFEKIKKEFKKPETIKQVLSSPEALKLIKELKNRKGALGDIAEKRQFNLGNLF